MWLRQYTITVWEIIPIAGGFLPRKVTIYVKKTPSAGLFEERGFTAFVSFFLITGNIFAV